METLPSNVPVAVSINHGAGRVSHCSESYARELLELMRALLDGAHDERSIISTNMMTTKGEVRCEWSLGDARAFADRLDAGLSLSEARILAQGRVVGKVDRYTRDAAKEITQVQTIYQY